jgi:endonuclease-3 related protein
MTINPKRLYQILEEKFGDLNWWPMDQSYHEEHDSDPRFEVIVGAILTQNTAWSNVEKALINLKSKKMLNIRSIADSEIENLQEMIKPSGFFKQKAQRLKNLAFYLKRKYNYNLDYFFNREAHIIRQELLSLNGIGPETADSILLYAGNKTVFVVDAYTRRICERLPLDTDISYDAIQSYFQTELAKSYSKKDITQVYNELHALIVIFAKKICKKKPLCDSCPLEKHCMFSKKLS